MVCFSELGLDNWIIRQLEDGLGIKSPTAVQQHCVPAILSGKDCVGAAKTGSGKTLAFTLPILHDLSKDPFGVFALILTPTRELAAQIADQLRVVGKPIGLRDCLILGGIDRLEQAKQLQLKPHVVVSTPGRLADLLETAPKSLKKIKYLVLDEADRLLDGGFDGQLATIFECLPPKSKRQTLLFSATISDSIEAIRQGCVAEGRPEPFVWEAESDTVTVDQLDQRLVLTPREAKDAYLVQVIESHYQNETNEKDLTIVFTNTCKGCQLLSMTLNALGFKAAALHSMIPQRERTAALAKFRSSQVNILIATDLASRGLDIPEVQLVLNHNVPSVTKDYVHRVGRTARAGRRGKALTLVTPHDVTLIKAVEDLVGVTMQEHTVDETRVAEIVAQVSVTKREQDVKLSNMDFDEKRVINQRKRLIMEGKNPDEEMRKKEKYLKKRRK